MLFEFKFYSLLLNVRGDTDARQINYKDVFLLVVIVDVITEEGRELNKLLFERTRFHLTNKQVRLYYNERIYKNKRCFVKTVIEFFISKSKIKIK